MKGELKMHKFKAVTLEITKKCNHRCTFCYNNEDNNVMDVSLNKIDYVIQKLLEYGIERVTVTGGEPFMVREQTMYLLKQLENKGFDTCLNTNLTLVDDELASFIEKILGHNNIVYSSIPSVIEDKCDKITQKKGSYMRIINGIEHCRNHGVKIGLNMSVSQINIDDLDQIIPFLKKYPVESFTLFPVIPPVYDRENIMHTNDSDNVIKVADTLYQISKELDITVGSIRPLPKCIIGNDEKYDIIRGSRCTTGVERFSIDLSTGEIEACSQENKKYGNIYRDSIQSCYDRMEEWRNNKFLAIVCYDCKILDKCGGMCLWAEPCGRC